MDDIQKPTSHKIRFTLTTPPHQMRYLFDHFARAYVAMYDLINDETFAGNPYVRVLRGCPPTLPYRRTSWLQLRPGTMEAPDAVSKICDLIIMTIKKDLIKLRQMTLFQIDEVKATVEFTDLEERIELTYDTWVFEDPTDQDQMEKFARRKLKALGKLPKRTATTLLFDRIREALEDAGYPEWYVSVGDYWRRDGAAPEGFKVDAYRRGNRPCLQIYVEPNMPLLRAHKVAKWIISKKPWECALEQLEDIEG